jgi:uncharacterized membrane-anchored protein
MTASTLGLGYFTSAALFAVLFCLPGLAYWKFGMNGVAAFWFAYVITRPLGASVSDWLGKPILGGLALGDGKVALVLGLAIAASVAFLQVSRVDVPREVPTTEAANLESTSPGGLRGDDQSS